MAESSDIWVQVGVLGWGVDIYGTESLRGEGGGSSCPLELVVLEEEVLKKITTRLCHFIKL